MSIEVMIKWYIIDKSQHIKIAKSNKKYTVSWQDLCKQLNRYPKTYHDTIDRAPVLIDWRMYKFGSETCGGIVWISNRW